MNTPMPPAATRVPTAAASTSDGLRLRVLHGHVAARVWPVQPTAAGTTSGTSGGRAPLPYKFVFIGTRGGSVGRIITEAVAQHPELADARPRSNGWSCLKMTGS